MVPRIAKLILVGTALSVSALAAPDLTPLSSHYEVEGVRFPNVAFRDGLQTITFTPPPGWRRSGGGRQLTLIPPEVTHTDMVIEVVESDQRPGMAGEQFDAWVQWSRKQLPRDATRVEVISVEKDPVKICGFETVGIGFTYDIFGVSLRTRAVLHLRGEKEVWRWQLTSKADDFKRLERPFLDSLYTVAGLDAPDASR